MAPNSRTLVCLGGGIEGLPMIRRAREMGLRTVVVDGNPDARGRALADVFVQASCYELGPTLKGLRDANVEPNAVLCCAIDAPLVAAGVAAEYGLPGISVKAAKLGVSKLVQKRVLKEAGIPIPRFAEPDDAWDPIPTWLAIKPVDSRGARGVIRASLCGNGTWPVEHARQSSPTARVILEEWLDGPQFSTESIIQDGKVLFTAVGVRNYDRLDEFAPYCVEDGFQNWLERQNVVLETFAINIYMFNDLIAKACAALGFDNCTVKGDLILNHGQLYILELAPRLSGGFFASHGHPLTFGVDFVGHAICLALGEKRHAIESRHTQFVCQRYVFPAWRDVGKTVQTIDQADVDCFHTWAIQPGDVIRQVTCHADRWGQAMATGSTPAEALEKARDAVAVMKAAVVLK